MHSIIVLALTDAEFFGRAQALNNYFENDEATSLERRGL